MQVKNTLRHTKTLTTLAVFSAISVVLVALIHFPIFPAAPYLEYDPADIPILICAFVFGPYAGLAMTAVVALVQGVTVSVQSGVYGILMHLVATGTYVSAAGFIHRAKPNALTAAAGVIAGTVAMAAVMSGANLIITPAFTGMPREAIEALILPVIVPFNLIKAGANGIIAFALYKPAALAAKKAGL
jgi:riboflavin transporter FmnP